MNYEKLPKPTAGYFGGTAPNHDIYRHPDRDYPIQIGRHGKEEIKTGTFNKLKKQIGFLSPICKKNFYYNTTIRDDYYENYCVN